MSQGKKSNNSKGKASGAAARTDASAQKGKNAASQKNGRVSQQNRGSRQAAGGKQGTGSKQTDVRKGLPRPLMVAIPLCAVAALAAVLVIFVLPALGGPGGIASGMSASELKEMTGDFQKNMNQSGFNDVNMLCEAEDGIRLEYDHTIFYLEKETKKATVLCNKPDCTHTTSDCNARMNTPRSIWYDGGKFWWTTNNTGDGTWVMAAESDLTGRRNVQQLEPVVNGDTTPLLGDIICHRGYVYFEFCDVLYRVPLGAESDKAEAIWGETAGEGETFNGGQVVQLTALVYRLWADGDYVYFMIPWTQTDGTTRDSLFRYDTNSGDVTQVWDTPSPAELGAWEGTDKIINGRSAAVTKWYVKDEYIYIYLSGNGLYRCKLGTSDHEKLADLPDLGSAIFGDDSMCLIYDSTEPDSIGDAVCVYNLDDGALQKTLSLEKIMQAEEGLSGYHMLAKSGDNLYLVAEAAVWSDYGSGDSGGVSFSASTMSSQRLVLYTVNLETGEITNSGLLRED